MSVLCDIRVMSDWIRVMMLSALYRDYSHTLIFRRRFISNKHMPLILTDLRKRDWVSVELRFFLILRWRKFANWWDSHQLTIQYLYYMTIQLLSSINLNDFHLTVFIRVNKKFASYSQVSVDCIQSVVCNYWWSLSSSFHSRCREVGCHTNCMMYIM